MKQLTTVLLCALLCACGTTSTLKGEQQTDYVLASKTQARGVWNVLIGHAVACKLTIHGITGIKYRISFDGDRCAIEAAK